MKDLVFSILNIFKYVGRIFSFIRNTFVNIILIILVLFFTITVFTSGPADIPNNSILKLSLTGDIVEERRTTSAFESFLNESLSGQESPSYMVLQDILDLIETAAFDPAIENILLDLKDLGKIGLDQMQTIGHSLEIFKHQNKKVFAAEDFYTQKQYYLASYADTIILNPMGGVELHGLGLYPLYFKDALDKLQVNYHIFRVGTYKSAIEPITRNSMSDEARSQNLHWLSTLWNTYTQDVARQRGLTTQTLNDYINNIDVLLAETKGDTAKLALDNRLVDLVLTREELTSHLEMKTGSRSEASIVSTSDYLSHIEPSYTESDDDQPQIGIIVAEGNIVGGKQPAGIIGSDSLTERLRSARTNKMIKGVVLRINSGGGSAFASEIIRQEILELKKAGKPVVVSMGSMAASGGYWISANADQIWASPVTLTGSIGIFGAIPTFENSLAHLGIHSDGVGTTPLSAGINLTRPLAPAVKASIQLTVNNGYNRFLDIVEQGRKIDKEQMPSIAEGRVFSGKTAKDLGLVDNLGSLNEAIDAVATLAGLHEFSPIYINRKLSVREELIQSFSTSISAFLPGLISSTPALGLYRELREQFGNLFLTSDPNGVYAHALLPLLD
ncbi:signal peptide peptidase SppA [Desulfopila aestuarii]|uniref:Signal peptide peptidase A. Serine peptidase. MEROPS family S49 n=1 Tax=Desulfopila aestuarii DSM 18488 TaxID=1121416 RepID=A0A1M7Y2B4_9BACT|nr:signal peptide peptidase SppA [Desulfopila aestuarii]SHO46008.1 signal peptide peptidase A. Serine peptidase. MEROPS family S49 [Desulfopila aestuarii DSM 18488]